MTTANHEEFNVQWTAPESRFLRQELAEAPIPPLAQIFASNLSDAIKYAAESKGAPADFVLAGLLSAASTAIGNSRWASPWDGWKEPPLIWTMLVGLPSSGKSPALDAVMEPLRELEAPLMEAARTEYIAWEEQEKIAQMKEKAWQSRAEKSIKFGKEPEPRPLDAIPPAAPTFPRLLINDTTIERLGVIISDFPRGTLQMRDELAGWLEGMVRYSAGNDRPFWLEAYGGRGYNVERQSRMPLMIHRLSVGVTGGIQPDRLKTLLFKSDDDGLLARFLPIWPEPVPVKAPQSRVKNTIIKDALQKLLSLELQTDKLGQVDLKVIPFSQPAREQMNVFREQVRQWESETEGLMLSFYGKLPGLSVRLSLVLTYLDWAVSGADEPCQIEENYFQKAICLIENYVIPMALRTYAEASVPVTDRAARKLISIIREKKIYQFSSREIMRMERRGLRSKGELDPVLDVLIDADCIRSIDNRPALHGGRPCRKFAVNPAVFDA